MPYEKRCITPTQKPDQCERLCQGAGSPPLPLALLNVKLTSQAILVTLWPRFFDPHGLGPFREPNAERAEPPETFPLSLICLECLSGRFGTKDFPLSLSILYQEALGFKRAEVQLQIPDRAARLPLFTDSGMTIPRFRCADPRDFDSVRWASLALQPRQGRVNVMWIKEDRVSGALSRLEPARTH